LRVKIQIAAAEVTGEIAAPLQEENRLAKQETGKRIVDGERRENKKAVAGDTLQDVEALVLVAAAEFQCMAATDPGKRAG
jgi:hypothetical protein